MPLAGSRGRAPGLPSLSDLLTSFTLDHAFLRLVWRNWAEVIPGKVYRSNHLPPWHLARAIRVHGLRSVVNLRGEKPNGSTALSRAVAERLGVEHHFMAFESRGAPHRERVLRFAELYGSLRFPVLLHCKSGADRAGLAAGLALLFEGREIGAAQRELSLRFLHFGRSKTGILDAFFARYAAEAAGRKSFLDWVREDYREEDLRRDFHAERWASFLNDRVFGRE